MAALDANVLVRFLVRDDTAQLGAAPKLIRRCVNAGETLNVPVTVWLELEWVLRSNFGVSKPEVVRTLSQLLAAAELSFESEAAIALALASQARQSPLWAFDKAASKLKRARWRAA